MSIILFTKQSILVNKLRKKAMSDFYGYKLEKSKGNKKETTKRNYFANFSRILAPRWNLV